MCGIGGIVERDGAPAAPRELELMMGALAHRGPDDRGRFVERPVGLGVTRLAIIDRAGGAQPVANEDDTVWLVYNGEIYNHRELRADLEARGHRFRSACDTEVIVHLYEELGVDCVRPLNGMFAFALWDARRRTLLLARDRLGIKPLFHATIGGRFVFASELKALLALPAAPRRIDRQALHDYLTFRYVPAPATILEGVSKLPAGHTLVYRDGDVRVARYWDLDYRVEDGRSDQEWTDELRERLEAAVARQLMSEVPLGVFLSGGIDSSSVVAMMDARGVRPVETFSIGFPEEPAADELRHARRVAARFQTRHHELVMRRDDFLADLPGAVWAMDEPVADPAGVPLLRLARAARGAGVIVLLSGEGGDEVLGGYAYWRKVRDLRLGRAVRSLPAPLQAGLAALQRRTGRFHFIRSATAPNGWPPLHSLSWIFTEEEKRALYADGAARVDLAPSERVLAAYAARVAGADDLNRMLYSDIKLWLPDDLLVKADRMTMAASVELRVPFLDHTFVEFAASMPSRLKSRSGMSKVAFKQALRPLLPPGIADRPKAGFPVPLAAWRRGPFMEFTRETLLSTRAGGRGYFRPGRVEWMLARHERGEGDYSLHLFNLACFELWCRQYLDRERPAAGAAPVPAAACEPSS